MDYLVSKDVSTALESPPTPDEQNNSPAPPAETAPPPDEGDSSPPPPPPEQESPPPPSASPPPPPTPDSSTPPPKSSPSPPAASNPPPSSSPPPPGGSAGRSSPPPPSGTLSPPPPVALSPPGAPGRPTPSPRPSRGGSQSGGTANSPPSSDSSSSNHSVLIAGVVLAGALLVAVIGIWLICSRKKKKQSYYADTGRPPKGNNPYYNNNWNSPMDHIVKLPQPPGMIGTPGGPPGMMGTPGGPGAGWGVPPPTQPVNNTSNEFSSGYSGHNQIGTSPGGPGAGWGGFNKSQFGYAELASATNGFSQANLLGQGGFGYVHKGVLADGRTVAVKSLKSGSGQGEREFRAEVEIISRVHHRHLVSLVGYCIADGQRMLVYEFVPNKTLEFHLHGKGQPVMEWEFRLRIARGSAKGLAYLHEDCYPKIIHRDIKAANILLDDKYEAMVADFGLAKLSSDNHTHVSTRVMGTFGYLAPEYASSGKLTEKSDVFSFGVMLLELITGKRPVDPNDRYMEDSLVDWARPVLAKALEDGDYREIADPRLEGRFYPHEMARMVACASASVRHSARRRPKMSQIVRALEGDSSLEDLDDAAKARSADGTTGDTQTYDTGMYNADMSKFRKMVMNSQEFNSSEFGGTSDYGLNPSSSSSDSREYTSSEPQKPKL